MGRQSARLYYKGKDHKDIYFQGKYHVKMYKGNQLLWEKLYPDKCLLNVGRYGIHIYDIENHFFDFMPVYNSLSSMSYLTCVGNALIVNLYNSEFDDDAQRKIAYSTDAEVFKEIAEIKAISNNGALTEPTFAYTNHSRAFLVSADDNKYTIATYNNGSLTFSKVSPYSSEEYVSGFVPGKGTYITVYGYYRDRLRGDTPLIYQVDDNGNIVDRLLFSNTTDIQVISYTYCCIGETIYSLGHTKDYDSYIIGKINTRSAVIEWDINHPINYKVPSHVLVPIIISVSEKEVITTVDVADGDDFPILSFRENEWSIVNILINGCVSVASTDGNVIRVFLGGSTQFSNITDTKIDIFTHIAYMDNHKVAYDGHVHGLFYVSITGKNLYNVYFDNPYFLESNGNVCEKIYS